MKEVKSIKIPVTYDRKEVFRYMGVHGNADEVEPLVTSVEAECTDILSPVACYALYDITVVGDTVDFGDFTVVSRDLAKYLGGCRRAVILVATVGFGIDRLIKKYTTLSPSRALALSALGTACIEGACDTLCTMLSRIYGATLPRYGVGYGDFPLASQADIFTSLAATKYLGVTLTDSYLMSPTKSVSAVVGIGHCAAPSSRCEGCHKTDCAFKGASI